MQYSVLDTTMKAGYCVDALDCIFNLWMSSIVKHDPGSMYVPDYVDPLISSSRFARLLESPVLYQVKQ